MQKQPQEIAEDIKRLVDQLVAIAKTVPPHRKEENQLSLARRTKGAIGALSVLIEEGFFDSPKDISAVMNKMKEMERYYSQSLVSMNLLNLTKPPRRILTRIKDSKTKKWQYVVRR